MYSCKFLLFLNLVYMKLTQIQTALEKKGVKTPLNDLGDDEQDSTHVNSKADTK